MESSVKKRSLGQHEDEWNYLYCFLFLLLSATIMWNKESANNMKTRLKIVDLCK